MTQQEEHDLIVKTSLVSMEAAFRIAAAAQASGMTWVDFEQNLLEIFEGDSHDAIDEAEFCWGILERFGA